MRTPVISAHNVALFPDSIIDKVYGSNICRRCGSIGASCILLESGKSPIVVDRGIRSENNKSPLTDLSIMNGKSLDAIILSHAHMDHSRACACKW